MSKETRLTRFSPKKPNSSYLTSEILLWLLGIRLCHRKDLRSSNMTEMQTTRSYHITVITSIHHKKLWCCYKTSNWKNWFALLTALVMFLFTSSKAKLSGTIISLEKFILGKRISTRKSLPVTKRCMVLCQKRECIFPFCCCLYPTRKNSTFNFSLVNSLLDAR